MNLPRPDNIADTILVTHAGCMDGSGCTIMFRRAGGKEENIRYVNAGTLEKFLKEELDSLGDRFIIIADVGLANGPHLERYADMLEKRGNVVLMDHHITSIGLRGRSWVDVRQDVCGTEMVREYFVDCTDDSLMLSEIIQDHDLWLEKHPRSKDLASYCVFFGQDVFVKNFMDRKLTTYDGYEKIFTDEEENTLKALVRKRDKTIEYIIKRAIIKDVKYNDDGDAVKVAYVITSEMNVSLLLDTLLDRNPKCSVACQVNFDRGTVSFRSRYGFDVSKMATYFGGGGHTAAAGHRIPDTIFHDVLEQLHGE